jgi:hypothetical protein
VSASVNVDTSVDVQWSDDSAYESSYEVYRSTSTPVTTNDTLVGTVGANVTSYVDTPSTDDTYYYMVRVVNNYDAVSSGDSGFAIINSAKFYDGATWQRRIPQIYDGSWTQSWDVSGYDSGRWDVSGYDSGTWK